MFPALYAILDPSLSPGPLAETAAIWADAGVRLIQLRNKHASAAKLYAEAKDLLGHLAPREVRLIVNDRPDIAAVAGAGGVHVGQGDLPVEEARRICQAPCWVGVSTHNLQQVREAAGSSADYIAVGPVFRTTTKENPDPIVGLDLVRAARELTRKPLVAIGGITVETAAEVFRAGADAVAVIRSLATAPDPVACVREFLHAAEKALSGRI